jgi:hypothetical protein
MAPKSPGRVAYEFFRDNGENGPEWADLHRSSQSLWHDLANEVIATSKKGTGQ